MMLADIAVALLLAVSLSEAMFQGQRAGMWDYALQSPALALSLFVSAWVLILWVHGAYRLRARWQLITEVRLLLRATVTFALLSFSFLYLSQLTSREARTDPAKRNSKVRRWLTYLTLFIASAVLIGDVIALMYNLLSGELTLRFILKMLTIAVIAGTTVTFYLWDIRADEQGPGA